MNAIKTLAFSVLLGFSVAGTASAGQEIQVPDLSATLQRQIEARMQQRVSADLEIATHKTLQLIVVDGEARPAPHRAS